MAEIIAQETVAREGLFVRRATGLVRDVSPFSATLFNVLPTVPGVGLAISVFWVLAVFPGAKMISGYWLVGLIALAIALPFAFLAAAIPRSGGDYMLVSRSLGPPFGLASSLSTMAAVLLATAFVASTFATVGLVPGLATIGLVSGSEGWVDAANTLSSKNWTLVISLGMLAITLLLGGLRLRTVMRFQNLSFAIAGLGLLAAAITMFTVSTESFAAKFDDVAGSGSYGSILRAAEQAGVGAPGTSWANTVPALGALAFLFVFSWWSSHYAGEIRAQHTWKGVGTMTISVLISVVTFSIMTWAFYNMAGSEFVAAANALSGTEDYPLSVSPFWLMFVAIAAKSTAFAVFLVITFFFWFPMWTWLQIAQPVRALFAWSFDGVLPSRVAYVSPRTHSPLVALAIVGILSIAGLVWSIYSSDFFTVLATLTLLNMTPMLFVAISAIAVPFLRPDIWKRTPVRGRVLGVPLLSLVGLIGLAAVVFVIYVLLKYPDLGIQHRARTLFAMGGSIVAGFALYYVVRTIQRGRGIDISLNYRVIPPE